MATDSVRKPISNDRALISTESIDVAWAQLQRSEAYWAGYSGMLIGGLVYAMVLSLVAGAFSFGVGVVFGIFLTVGFLGLLGVIGVLIFLLVRAINASLNWPLSSRYAAAAAACLTGLFLFFLPVLVFGEAFDKGIPMNFVCWGPVILTTFLQAGAWLGTDRDIRKFEQRVAFSQSDKVDAKKQYRFDIVALLVCTFWLAGAMAILLAMARLNESRESNFYIIVALAVSVFLSLGFSAVLVFFAKTLRGLQKRLFYRKPSFSN